MFLYSQHSDTGTKEALDMLDPRHSSWTKATRKPMACARSALHGVHIRDGRIAIRSSRRPLKGPIARSRDDPQEPWAYLAHGFVAMAKQRNSDAVDAFSRAIDASPNFAYAHGLLGSAHSAGGRPDQAIECIDRGVRLSPRDIFGDEYQLYYAFAHFQAGRYAEAASAAQRAIQQRPGHPVLYIMAAASYGLAGETEKARRRDSAAD